MRGTICRERSSTIPSHGISNQVLYTYPKYSVPKEFEKFR